MVKKDLRNEELNTLDKILYKLKMSDIDVDYDGDTLIAKDDNNVWKDDEIYRFLIGEAFVYDDDGSDEVVVGIPNELLAKFYTYAGMHGVAPFKEVTMSWILRDDAKGTGVCSVCHRQDHIDPLATHCRYCGARIKN